MSYFTDRIDELLKKKMLKRQAMCETVGIAPNSVAIWSTRGTIPAADILLKIADYLGTSVEWLVTGKEKAREVLSQEEKEVIENMREMDERGRAEMVEISRIKRPPVENEHIKESVG